MIPHSPMLVTPVAAYGGWFTKLFKKKKKKQEELSPVDLEIKRIQGNIKGSLKQQQLAKTEQTIRRENTTASVAVILAVSLAAAGGLWYYNRRNKRAK